MAKLKQVPRNCGTCHHLVEGRYEDPVCYQIEQRNGKPVAAKVKRNGKACQSYRERIGAGA